MGDRQHPDRGGVVWLTGLPCAGKSTLARALVARLAPARPVELLDADEVRPILAGELGYSREDRDASVRRIAYVARLLATHGVLAIVAAIAPYAATREELRRRSEEAGHPFVEVYVNAPLETAIARDVKGLYRRAQAGEIRCFTGISDPYEPPRAPVLELQTDRETPAESEAKLLRVLARLGLA